MPKHGIIGNKVVLFWATFMREQGDFTTAQSDFNAAQGDSESPTRAVLGAELARRGRVLSERGKVGKGAERKVKNHFIDHSYHFIPKLDGLAHSTRDYHSAKLPPDMRHPLPRTTHPT